MKNTLPLLLLTAFTAFAQGPLAPPATSGPLVGPFAPLGAGGLPQPAMKTLHQIEPRTPLSGGVAAHVISAPGSYQLTGNVNQSGTSNAIRIDAEDVTLDLNGVSVIGAFSGANLAGISIDPSARNVAVRNGVVRNWSGHAINASAPRFFGEGLRLLNNGLDGISTGSYARILDCHALGNGSAGFRGFDSCVIRECSATENGVQGIRFMNHTVDGCVAGRNKGAGIVCTSASVITNNHCVSNGGGVPAGVGPGIFGVSTGNRIDHNHVSANTHGIKLLTSGNFVTGNISRSNSWSIIAGNRVAPLVTPPRPMRVKLRAFSL